jgi:Ca2+-binding RTX toxin-like protein
VETLANGNFVVGWDRGGLGNGNSYFQIYDTNGNEVHSTNPRALANGSDEQNLDDILALKEGGFYAVHTNDTTGQIVGQRYSATGAAIGGTSTFTGSGADLSLTQDGRIVVTYTRNGDIYQVILDPREGFFGGTDDPDLYAGRQIDDVLGGGLGNDTLYGVGGNDFIGGAEDNDLLFGGAGGDTMNGNAGSDTMDGGTGNDELFGSTGNDRLIGGAGDDGLNGGDGSDTVFGSIGDDTIRNSLRGDSLSGGDGTDTLDNSGLAGGFGKGGLTSIHVDLRDETASVNDGLISPAIVSILGFENAIGTQSGNDILRGNGAANELTGGSGLNLLVGRVGDDILDGKSGNDTMTGGIGADTFVFSSALDGTANVDEITDFDVAEDTIQLSSTVFTAIAPGPLSADAFRLAGQTADTEDRIIYNASTGYLLYDADGSGTAATAIRFARLDAGLGVTADDFVIV